MERVIEPIKLLIAEDEPPQRRALEALLREVWPEAELCASCSDGVTALEAFARERPAVAFLDLRMPGLGGLEVARAIAGAAHVVFITAYDDAAITAFEQGAVDYVLKPVRRERLERTVARLQDRLRAPPAPGLDALVARLRAELGGARPPGALRWVTATVRDAVKLYAIDDILAFQAQDKYTRALTATDEAILRTSLRELTGQLDPEVFWHVHRSVIVRATAIDEVRRDALGRYRLTLKGRADVLPLSSAFYGRLRGM
jgi:DNA-binding LytR/AlgR family response regulator